MLKSGRNLLMLILGVLFLFFAGLLGCFIGSKIPFANYLLICISIGLVLSNIMGLPNIIERGICDTHKIWLEAGIMVLGARILLYNLLKVGPILLSLVLLFLTFSLFFTHFLASHIGLEHKFASILSSGVSVCGVSAVVATGGAIKTKEKHIAYAIAAVLVFDITTMFLWPTIGTIFSIPAKIFGPWAGLTSPSTGPTIAIGFIHSDKAGQLCTMTKMARNAFIGVWALLFTFYYARKGVTSKIESKGRYLWDKFPKFVLGFLLMLILANIGFITEAQIEVMKNAYSWLFMMAFVGLGYNALLNNSY